MIENAIPPSALRALPVFPLPEVVLFPGTALPLHVFEDRYLAMVEHALENDGYMAIVMLRDPDDDADERPPLHEVGCGGRIVHVDRLDDGRMNILVHGLQRVVLGEELALEEGFRRFRAELVPRPDRRDLDLAADELARMQSCVVSLQNTVAQTDKQLVEVLGATADPVELADILSAVLVHEPWVRQRLLAARELKPRLGGVIDAIAEVLVQVGETPKETQLN